MTHTVIDFAIAASRRCSPIASHARADTGFAPHRVSPHDTAPLRLPLLALPAAAGRRLTAMLAATRESRGISSRCHGAISRRPAGFPSTGTRDISEMVLTGANTHIAPLTLIRQ